MAGQRVRPIRASYCPESQRLSVSLDLALSPAQHLSVNAIDEFQASDTASQKAITCRQVGSSVAEPPNDHSRKHQRMWQETPRDRPTPMLVPPELGNLANLQRLDLSRNRSDLGGLPFCSN